MVRGMPSHVGDRATGVVVAVFVASSAAVLPGATPTASAERPLPAAARLDTSDAALDTQARRAPRAEGAADERDPRLYVTGMVASSGQWRGDGVPVAPTAVGFSGAGGEAAAGLAVPRPAGWLRLELEGRGREAAGSPPQAAAGDWSSMVNVWRDVDLGSRVGLYAGGGVGAGGVAEPAAAVTPAAPAVPAGLAWQAGAGVTYAATERVTLDLGYRHRAIGPGAPGDGEVLLAVRVFDPFRGWLR
jgi:opacity protein-like surface antigen